MAAVISMLRGVNVGGHNLIKMEALRALYSSLGLRDPQTYVQSGNVVFVVEKHDPAQLAKHIEDAIEKKFGFRPEVVVRTAADLKDALKRNPFARRAGIEPGKLLINFLAEAPAAEVREAILAIKPATEELRIDGREIYIYFPDGMGQSKLWPAISRKLKKPGTGRNLNTVQKLLEMAEEIEG